LKKDDDEKSNLFDSNQESQSSKFNSNLKDFEKEMEGSTYKIQNNGKKLNIQCSVF